MHYHCPQGFNKSKWTIKAAMKNVKCLILSGDPDNFLHLNTVNWVFLSNFAIPLMNKGTKFSGSLFLASIQFKGVNLEKNLALNCDSSNLTNISNIKTLRKCLDISFYLDMKLLFNLNDCTIIFLIHKNHIYTYRFHNYHTS